MMREVKRKRGRDREGEEKASERGSNALAHTVRFVSPPLRLLTDKPQRWHIASASSSRQIAENKGTTRRHHITLLPSSSSPLLPPSSPRANQSLSLSAAGVLRTDSRSTSLQVQSPFNPSSWRIHHLSLAAMTIGRPCDTFRWHLHPSLHLQPSSSSSSSLMSMYFSKAITHQQSLLLLNRTTSKKMLWIPKEANTRKSPHKFAKRPVATTVQASVHLHVWLIDSFHLK